MAGGRPRIDGGTPEQIKARERERQRAKYKRRHHDRPEAAAGLRDAAARDKASAQGPRRRKSETLSKPLPERRAIASSLRAWPADSIIKPPTMAQLMGGR